MCALCSHSSYLTKTPWLMAPKDRNLFGSVIGEGCQAQSEMAQAMLGVQKKVRYGFGTELQQITCQQRIPDVLRLGEERRRLQY